MSRQLYRSFHIQQTIDKQEDVYNEAEREYKNLQKQKSPKTRMGSALYTQA